MREELYGIHFFSCIQQTRRPYRTKLKLLTIILTVFSVWILFVYILLRQHHRSTNEILKFSGMKATTLHAQANSASIVILLQQSPVDPKNQIARLINIDKTWARWILGTNMSIYASIPSNQYNDSIDQALSIVKPLQLIYPLEFNINPFYHLVRANDHTFIILPNLYSLLQNRTTYNPSTPLYLGNLLQRGKYKHGFVLHFASGGAGIILSHVSVKLFILSLAFVNDTVLANVLSITDFNLSPTHNCELYQVGVVYEINVDEASNIYCGIKLLPRLKSLVTQYMLLNTDIQARARLSKEHYNVDIRQDVNDRKFFMTYPTALNYLNEKDILKACSATTSWDTTNPALVLAYCLQKAFQIRPSSVDVHSDVSGNTTILERLNCFGIVRTLYGDVDDWYALAKLPFNANAAKRIPLKQPIRIAPDVISFHYVSEQEASILYGILSKKILIPSKEQLQYLWPKTNKEAGPYSRWRFHNDEELENLFHHLTQYIILKT